MRVAFDLDFTLISHDFPPETVRNYFWHFCYPKEFLREGIITVCEYLREQQIEIWVYTSSFRGVGYIRGLFRKYQIPLDGIVNQALYVKEISTRKSQNFPSKYPSFWEIDLLIDDQPGIKLEGAKYGFDVVILDPQNDDWARELIEYIQGRIVDGI